MDKMEKSEDKEEASGVDQATLQRRRKFMYVYYSCHLLNILFQSLVKCVTVWILDVLLN